MLWPRLKGVTKDTSEDEKKKKGWEREEKKVQQECEDFGLIRNTGSEELQV